MAARSSAGVGVGITITLLGVACLALFITTIVFYSKYQKVDRDLASKTDDWNSWVSRAEQTDDTIARLHETAKKGKKSVVGYLNDSLRDSMQKVTGTASDNVDQLTSKIKSEGAEGTSLLSFVADQKSKLADLTSKLAQSEKDRTTALADLQAEADRVKTKVASYDKTVATLNSDIDRYKGEVEQYREAVNQAKSNMDQTIEKTREQATSKEAALGEHIRKIEEENLQLNGRISILQQAKTKDILKPTPEQSLVDGTIIGAVPGSGEVTINRGTKDHIVLGMSFAVYNDATAIKPGPDGEYPLGMASIEVVNIGESSSTCRITRETKGNPIVKGAVVANAIYDPSKVYTFLVYGSFDAKGDGVPTPGGADDVKALIDAWGGKTTEELTGSVDFLVLGERPVVPPAPSSGSPPALVMDYMRRDKLAAHYDDLYKQAVATSLPILNENRLYTLIGRRPGVR
jgi:hypothetical protein